MATESLDSSCKKKNEGDFPGSEKKTEALDSCKKMKNEEDFPGSEKKRKFEGCDLRVVSSPDQREGVRYDDHNDDESAIKKTRNEDSGTSILGCNNNNNNNETMIIVHVSNNQTQRKSFGRLKRTARCRVLPTHKIRIIRGMSYDESDDEL